MCLLSLMNISISSNDQFSVTEWLNEVKDVDSDHLGLPVNFEVSNSKPIEQELNEIIQLFRLYMKASFKLCNKAVNLLQEMGFKEDDIKKALRYTGNNIPESVSKNKK